VSSSPTPVLYLAPWVDYGGTDKGTIDWFRCLDHDRFAPSLMTTQPSPNRRLREVEPYAEEVWNLPDMIPGEWMPNLVFDFIHSRRVRLLHVMNSRLGFDLLADLACLPDPPKVVVQLHVEESDRSGYVRYVTTRYGNLVDAFSVTSEHLAEAVHGYGISREKIHVIYTGVDGDEEFCPERVAPIESLPAGPLNILYPGRLVDQKDPLLMVEVAAGLRDRDVDCCIHAVGEGELEGAVRSRIADLGLDEQVQIHPPTTDLERWYAACDILLMTSVFEGVPYVLFEAMAMGLPAVVPALPGNRELIPDTEGLVEPRDAVESYVDEVARLAADPAHRTARGASLRAHARDRLSLQRMADDHCELYAALLERGAESADPAPLQSPATPIRFVDRPLFDDPLVSVIVPHYNQSAFVRECVDSVRAQTYPSIELVLVDDASTEQDAARTLDDLEASGATVVRLSRNGGPSRARNAGIKRSSGRYVLPVDADNVLVPDAIEKLVAQLAQAPEDVGFIYPNLQFFGNRDDYFEAPAYDRYRLLSTNFCDTCSLIDRRVFDAGEYYPEDVFLGHEDWEFALRLGMRGIRGEPARGRTVLYRKWGFNRADAVDHGSEPFRETIAKTPEYESLDIAALKAEDSPALSWIVTAPAKREDPSALLAERAAAQSCCDLEVIVTGDAPSLGDSLPQIRRLPQELADTPDAILRHARSIARGAFHVASICRAGSPLADRALVEKLLRRLEFGDSLDAIALADAGATAGLSSFATIPDDVERDPVAHTVAWRVSSEELLATGLRFSPAAPAPSLVRALTAAGGQVEWRHSALTTHSAPPNTDRDAAWVTLPSVSAPPLAVDPLSPDTEHPPPLLPGLRDRDRIRRWEATPTWTPPQSILLCRHRAVDGEQRVVTNSRESPPGYEAEHDLGVLRLFAFEGTERVVHVDGQYLTVPRGNDGPLPEGAVGLGYVEQAPFPLLDGLALAIDPAVGEETLVTLPDDPLLDRVDLIRTLGFIEGFPVHPRETPRTERQVGLVGITKASDPAARRHRYAAGAVPPGELIGELGALSELPISAEIPVWIVDGQVITDRHRPPASRLRLVTALRWTGAPLRWSGAGGPAPRSRAALRRAHDVARSRARSRRRPIHEAAPGAPAGWLFEQPRRGLAPLYAAYHPVTGDQLLSRTEEEAPSLGYGPPALLGHMHDTAPVTGSLDQRPVAIPWASRFGKAARR